MNRNKDITGFVVALALGIVCAVMVGCDPPRPAMSLQEKCRLGAHLALTIASSPAPTPTPPPVPQGDSCPDCGGAGKVGDGTVFRTCLTCGGTGKRKVEKDDPEPRWPEPTKPQAAAPQPERYAVPPKDGRVYKKVCRNGVCSWEPVQ